MEKGVLIDRELLEKVQNGLELLAKISPFETAAYSMALNDAIESAPEAVIPIKLPCKASYCPKDGVCCSDVKCCPIITKD